MAGVPMIFSATRLAPSPTGALHLGHARTFLVTWWMARQAGAKVFMRMEDLDEGRAKAESVGQAYADLRWLGMGWDGFGTGNLERGASKEEGTVVQSGRMGVYSGVLEELWRRGVVYPCTCTRAEIVASVAGAASAPHEGEGGMNHPGTCAGETWNAERGTLKVAEVTERVRRETRKAVCWRFRVREGVIAFEDQIMGRQAFDVAAEVGDFPVTRFVGVSGADGIAPAYQLACVADDHAMGIDLVVRGDDLLSSTPRQMLLYEAMGWAAPRFAHVPLVVGVDGKRLAKRHGESRIAQFREKGVRAEKIVGWVAWRSGQIGRLREMGAAEMIAGFEVGKLPRERVVLGAEDLAWLR